MDNAKQQTKTQSQSVWIATFNNIVAQCNATCLSKNMTTTCCSTSSVTENLPAITIKQRHLESKQQCEVTQITCTNSMHMLCRNTWSAWMPTRANSAAHKHKQQFDVSMAREFSAHWSLCCPMGHQTLSVNRTHWGGSLCHHRLCSCHCGSSKSLHSVKTVSTSARHGEAEREGNAN